MLNLLQFEKMNITLIFNDFHMKLESPGIFVLIQMINIYSSFLSARADIFEKKVREFIII
jgi:hypothetical protein